jgi:16S rRNA (guanine527-N7)-methyltransferase
MGSLHSAHLQGLGVPAGLLGPLEIYLSLVATWNEKTNLTAARSAEDRVRILVADAWRAAPLLHGSTLIDVGSGNGSPGLVLAMLRSDLSVTLLEPRARRWAFLREAARRLDRPDVQVERVRCEDFGGRADTVTVRAVGLDLASAARLLVRRGELWVFGGQPEAAGLTLVRTHPLDHSELHVFQGRDN